MTTAIRAPFLDVQSFAREEGEVPAPKPSPGSWSPFLSVYEFDKDEHQADEPVREAYSTLVNELYDEEFEESLFELLTSARALHQDHLASGHALVDADRIVTHHFAQLTRESESMLDAMGREFGSRQAVTIDQEFDAFGERYTPATPLEPEFQDFLGKLAKKIGKGVRAAAKTAVKGIATLALGPVLNKIKALVKPLLNQVLQKAIGKLPEAIRPVAHTLAARLGFATRPPTPPAQPPPPGAASTEPAAAAAADADPALAAADPAAIAGSPVQPSAGDEVPDLQLELDEFIAEAMLSEDEQDLEWELARARVSSNGGAAPAIADLDDARERFGEALANLKEGENPAPHVENFLPAVLPALRIATRLIGRPRVVNFLAGLLGKLISKLVGPAQTPALSRAIVDAGLKLVSLEVTDQEDPRLATSALTATIEETLTRVASLPDHVFENEELLEGFAVEAFEQAAAVNLPALFSDATYKKRPDLLEGGVNATWMMLPLRRPRYKRCSRTFNVTITPHMAETIESFEDTPLSEYFQDQLELSEGADVEAEVHLFEVLPGGTAADIARYETETPGLGSADEATLSQLQPLTHEAAGALLGRPALGRALRPGSNVRTLVPGQRVYHMVIGRRPMTVAGPLGRRRVRRLVRVEVILDTPRDQVRVCLFFSEVKAQRLAVRLRQQSHVGALAVAFQKLLGRRLPHILHGRRGRRLRIVHPSVPPGAAPATVVQRLPAVVPQAFIAKMQEWLVAAFSEFAKTQAQTFLAAAQDPADGVTLVFTIEQPPGLKGIADALAGKGAAAQAIAESIMKGSPPTVRVAAFSGRKCD